jgi:hypothetical protein
MCSAWTMGGTCGTPVLYPGQGRAVKHSFERSHGRCVYPRVLGDAMPAYRSQRGGPYRRDMAKKDSCRTCNGQGGWWETGNSTPSTTPKRWVKCSDCSGTGEK